MASSQKTTAFGLNKWILDDKILMEDFNADNETIANALAERPYIKLLDVTTTEDALQVDLDVGGIDMTEYSQIQIMTRLAPSGAVSGASLAYMRVNGIISGYGTGTASETNSLTTAQYLVPQQLYNGALTMGRVDLNYGIRPSTGRSEIYVRAYSGANYRGLANQGALLDKADATPIHTINFFVDGANRIKAGARFVAYGIKF